MPTPNLVIRLADDLRVPAEARAKAEHRTLTEVVRSALRQYLTGSDGGEAYHHMQRRAEEAEARLSRAEDELAAARSGVIADAAVAAGKQARAGVRAAMEARFTAAFTAATRENPATAPRLAALSGFGAYWCRDLLRALADAGYAEKTGPGQWVPVPGKDVREGIGAGKRLAQTGAARIAPSLREKPDGPSPAPAPAVTAETATEPAEASPAPGQEEPGRGGTATKLRTAAAKAPLVAADRRKPVTTEHREQADAIAPGTALFQQPGTERVVTQPAPVLAPSCPPHPKRRVVKGYCGACGRNVGFEKLA